MSKDISYFTRAPEDEGEPVAPGTTRPPQPRQSTDLAHAARQLTLAAQGASARPSSDIPVSHGAGFVTPPNKTKLPIQGGSPFVDPKYSQGRDKLGRKPSAAKRKSSAVGAVADAEEFYRSAASSPDSRLMISRTQTPLPMTVKKTPEAMQPYTREPKPVSEEIGLCDYEIQAQRLSMARLTAAKILIEQAYAHKDLDQNIAMEDQPLYYHGGKLKEILWQLMKIIESLDNDKIVKNYEEVFTAPENSEFYGKTFEVVVPADAGNMLSGVQAIADQIMREIE